MAMKYGIKCGLGTKIFSLIKNLETNVCCYEICWVWLPLCKVLLAQLRESLLEKFFNSALDNKK